jgi:hypothetical protein
MPATWLTTPRHIATHLPPVLLLYMSYDEHENENEKQHLRTVLRFLSIYFTFSALSCNSLSIYLTFSLVQGSFVRW